MAKDSFYRTLCAFKISIQHQQGADMYGGYPYAQFPPSGLSAYGPYGVPPQNQLTQPQLPTIYTREMPEDEPPTVGGSTAHISAKGIWEIEGTKEILKAQLRSAGIFNQKNSNQKKTSDLVDNVIRYDHKAGRQEIKEYLNFLRGRRGFSPAVLSFAVEKSQNNFNFGMNGDDEMKKISDNLKIFLLDDSTQMIRTLKARFPDHLFNNNTIASFHGALKSYVQEGGDLKLLRFDTHLQKSLDLLAKHFSADDQRLAVTLMLTKPVGYREEPNYEGVTKVWYPPTLDAVPQTDEVPVLQVSQWTSGAVKRSNDHERASTTCVFEPNKKLRTAPPDAASWPPGVRACDDSTWSSAPVNLGRKPDQSQRVVFVPLPEDADASLASPLSHTCSHDAAHAVWPLAGWAQMLGMSNPNHGTLYGPGGNTGGYGDFGPIQHTDASADASGFFVPTQNQLRTHEPPNGAYVADYAGGESAGTLQGNHAAEQPPQMSDPAEEAFKTLLEVFAANP